uniref:Titin n=1 Tax=Paramormyrops kingsleyae TaxID=1676925 RepID=A0A3B3QB10_9TELE
MLTASNPGGFAKHVFNVKVLDRPGPPDGPLAVTDVTAEKCILSWLPPSHDGGAKIEHYIIEKRETSRLAWTNVASDVQVNRFKVTKLLKGNEYIFRVMAVNKYGVGEPLESEPVMATNPYVLFVPIRGRPAPEVKWSREHGEPLERATIESTSSFTSVLIENVSRVDSGKYVLTVENGSGSKTAFVNVRVLDTPGAPQNLMIKEVTKESVSLIWDPPLIDGGSRIRNYIIEKRESTRKAYSTVSTSCHKTSWKIGQLEEGRNYFFRVLAENEYGIGLPTETTESVKVSEKPLPPGKVTLQDVSSNSVTLSWEKPDHDGGSRITGYIVEMQSKGSEKWTECLTVKVNEAVVAGLTQGEEYLFRVSAMNEKGISDPRQLSVPVIAKDLVIVPSFKLLFSAFSVLAGDDLKVDVPYVARPKAAVSWQKDGVALKETTRVNAEITERHLYLVIKEACRDDVGQYTIKLSNTAGEATAEIKIVVLDKPGPPTGPIKIDEVTADSVALSWEPPEYDGGCSINNYIVEKRDTSTTNWQIVSATVARTTIKAARLKTGTEYQFRIAAENRYGKSSVLVSESVVAQYPFKLPGPPGTPSVQSSTKESMVVIWNKPSDDGGSKILGYHLESKERNSILWVKQNKTLIQDTRFKVTGLEEGIEYEFRVYAENIVGIGKVSKQSEIHVARDPCECPGTPEAVIVTRNSVTLRWTKPEFHGGSKITGYLVEKKELPGGRWMKATIRVDGGQYTLVLKNVGGEKSVNVNVKVLDRPGPPEGPISIYGVASEKCFISWKPPQQDGGSDVTHYIVERRETSRLVWTVVESKVQTLNLKITKLLEGNEYIFRVIPVNKYGIGEPLESEPVIAKNPFVTPNAPTAVEVSNITKDSMVVTWERPTKDGGNPIAGYIVEKRDKEGVRWTRCNKRSVSELRFRVTGLLESRSYEFRVSAENAAGVGAPSSSSVYYKALDPIFKPGPPNNAKVADVSRTSVSLSWGKPIYDGGCEIQGYIVEACEVPSEEWTMCTPPSGITQTHFEIKKLQEKQEYKFRVYAINKAGVGEHADISGTIVVEEKIEAPDLDLDPELRKMITVRAGGSLRLFIPIRGRPVPEIKWEKADGEIKDTAQIDTTSSYTSLVIENVDRFDSGKYTVTAENASGVKSVFISVRVLDTPSEPINFKVKEITKSSVTLTWEPPLLDETPESLKVSEVPQPPGKVTVVDVTRSSVSLSWEKPEHDGGSR